MLANLTQPPARDAETLQREMKEARSDMAGALEELKLAVDPRRQLLLHPWTSLAILAVIGAGVTLGVRRFMKNRRLHSALQQLAAANGRRSWIF